MKRQWVIYNEAVRCLRLKGWESQGARGGQDTNFYGFCSGGGSGRGREDGGAGV